MNEYKKSEIYKVYSVFEEYIRNREDLDWFESQKIGPVLLILNVKEWYVEDDIVITNAEHLCEYMLLSLITDVQIEMGSKHGILELTEKEKQEVWKRWVTFMDHIPEYKHVWNDFFQRIETVQQIKNDRI